MISEPSEVAICNLALQEIGRGAMIVALDENTQAARVCRLRYPFARDAVLRAYDWNFASARDSLAAAATPPAFGFAFQYPLPGDCLFVRSIEDCEAWKVEGRQVLTDRPPPLNIAFTRSIVNPASFDTLFIHALATRIAADIAVSLSESLGKAQSLWQIYMAKLGEARRRDAQEGQAEDLPEGTWLDARG